MTILHFEVNLQKYVNQTTFKNNIALALLNSQHFKKKI